MNLSEDKRCNVIQRHKNTTAVIIPIALDEVCEMGMTKPGDNLMIVGLGVLFAQEGLIYRSV